MLVVSDSVTALLPIFSTNEEVIFCTDLFNDKLHFGGYNTIIVGGRQTDSPLYCSYAATRGL